MAVMYHLRKGGHLVPRVVFLCIIAGWVRAVEKNDLRRGDSAKLATWWEPEREFEVLHPDVAQHEVLKSSTRLARHAAVRAERNRSLSEFRRPQTVPEIERVLRDIFAIRAHKERVLVLNARIFVHKNFLQVSGKNLQHLSILATALKLGQAPPNSVYLYSSAASGRSAHRHNASATPLPTVMMAKTDGYQALGILAPNPYFGEGDLARLWPEFCARFIRERRTRPFEARDPRVFWRGEVEGRSHCGYKCSRDHGNYARFQAISLTLARPDLFDVKAGKVFAPRDETQCLCPEFPYDAAMRSAASSHEGQTVLDHHFWLKEDYAKFKFLLNLPGKTSGSYSRNLNHLWSLGSIVLLWDSPVVEWYYPALRSGDTHLSINKSSGISVLEQLITRPDLQASLAQAATEIHDDFLCPECIARAMIEVMQDIRDYFKFGPYLDNFNRLLPFLIAKSKCDIKSGWLEITFNQSYTDFPTNGIGQRQIKGCDFFGSISL